MNLDYHCQIYGVTQSGKTFLALRLLMEQPGLRFFIDTKNESKYHRYFDYFIKDVSGLKLVLDNAPKFVGKSLVVEVKPEVEFSEQLEQIAKMIFLHQRQNPMYRVTLLIDELQEYVTNRSVKQFIRALFVQGLSKNIRVIFTSQGWSMIQKNIRNNCEITVVLKLRDNDIHDMMELGLLPYETNEYGHKVPLVKFQEPYEAYMEYGIKGSFRRVQ